MILCYNILWFQYVHLLILIKVKLPFFCSIVKKIDFSLSFRLMIFCVCCILLWVDTFWLCFLSSPSHALFFAFIVLVWVNYIYIYIYIYIGSENLNLYQNTIYMVIYLNVPINYLSTIKDFIMIISLREREIWIINLKLKKSLVVPKEKENITHYNKNLKNLNQFKKIKINQTPPSFFKKKKLKIIERCGGP